MKFSMKKAGILFSIFAVVVLAIVGCCFAFGTVKENISDLQNPQDSDWQTIVDLPYVADENTVRLNQATDAEMTVAFKEAVKKSANEGKLIKVVLEKDWGCSAGIFIEIYSQILLELNGHKIYKNSDTNGSSIFYVAGIFFLTDSVYRENAESIKGQVNAIYDRFDNNEINKEQVIAELDKIQCGKITGGNCPGGYGGAVNVTSRQLTDANNQVVWQHFGKMYVYGGLFYNNFANKAGAFYTYPETIMHIYDGVIAGNESGSGGGGGISITGFLRMTGGLVAGNASQNNGAGLLLYTRDGYYNRIFIENIEIRSNVCEKNGGGIMCIDTSLIMSNVKIYNNQVPVKTSMAGGGICIQGASNTYMKNCELYGNVQNYGGAIYSSSHLYQRIVNTSVHDNTSYRHAGGVYFTSTSVGYLEDVTIENNIVRDGALDCGGAGLQMYANAMVFAKNIVVRNNKVIGGKLGGGILVSSTGRLYLSGENDISDNYIKDDVPSDLCLYGGAKLVINNKVTLKPISSGGSGKPIVYEMNTNIFDTITLGYSVYNSDVDPATLFKVEGARTILKNGEVAFDFSANSVYDFTYLEGGKRKYYKDNDILFGNNDSAMTTKVLGKVVAKTSVNDFIKNIEAFKFSDVKLFAANDEQVYGSGADSKYTSLLNNSLELSVGTGWYITCNANGKATTIYITVLGDLTGDGKINSLDVSIMNKVLNDEMTFADLELPQQLAALIINKGAVTSVDSRVLWEVSSGKSDIEMFI